MQAQCFIDEDLMFIRSLVICGPEARMVEERMRKAQEVYEGTMCIVIPAASMGNIDPAGAIVDPVRGAWTCFMIYGRLGDGSYRLIPNPR